MRSDISRLDSELRQFWPEPQGQTHVRVTVEKNPDLKGRLYQKADRKGLVGRSKRDFKNYLHFGFVPSNYEHERMCVASLCRLGSGRFLKFELN